jgi:hypothetical protein
LDAHHLDATIASPAQTLSTVFTGEALADVDGDALDGDDLIDDLGEDTAD